MKQGTIYIIGTIAIAAILLCGWLQFRSIRALQEELDRYRENTEVLFGTVEQYKVRDSLNAARVQSLELTLDEYKRFRAEDAALIQQLKGRNRDLSAVNKMQAQTIFELRATPRDTVVLIDSVKVDAVAVHCGDAWFDFDGLLTADRFDGTLRNRDSLIVAETVRYKRFLGFLWKTRKVKDRRVDVMSKNPHTEIMGVEFITINN